MENTLLQIMIENETKIREIQDFIIEDHIEIFSANLFKIAKKTNEVVFIYSQNYYINGGYYPCDIDVELLSEPNIKAYSYAMMENNFIKTIFKAYSNIEFSITCNATVTSVIRYVKIIPIKYKKKQNERN